jgi:CubicO group peptidase (beta-lactamase class C family)
MKFNTINLKYSILIFFLYVGTICAQTLDADYLKFIDSIVSPFQETPGMTLLVAKDGNVLYKKAYGYANYELKAPNKTHYSFAIGSVSKQFTAVAILKLAENNKLSIKDNVKKYLPWFKTQEQNKITIEHLLSHTSGVKDFFTNEDFIEHFVKPFSKDSMLQYMIKEIPFESNPGAKYKYNNAGYVYLKLIIEQASGLSFDEFMTEEIFKPLNMDATFVGSPNKLVHGTVTGYNVSRDGNKKILRESYLHQNLNWVGGAGTIYSSVEDMLKWDESFYTNKIISSESINLAQTPFTLNDGTKTKYGFGFEVDTDNGVKIITHSGLINGFEANMIRIPKYQIYIVGMSNRIDFAPDFIYTLAKKMIKNEPN